MIILSIITCDEKNYFTFVRIASEYDTLYWVFFFLTHHKILNVKNCLIKGKVFYFYDPFKKHLTQYAFWPINP